MYIKCPNCDAIYNISEDSIPSLGRVVICSKCSHEWFCKKDELLDERPADEITAKTEENNHSDKTENIAEPEEVKSDENVEEVISTAHDMDSGNHPAILSQTQLQAALLTISKQHAKQFKFINKVLLIVVLVLLMVSAFQVYIIFNLTDFEQTIQTITNSLFSS